MIIGKAAKDLNSDAKRRSFERFRERLVGVRVLTFDGGFRRIESLVSLSETAQQEGIVLRHLWRERLCGRWAYYQRTARLSSGDFAESKSRAIPSAKDFREHGLSTKPRLR